MSVFEIPPGKGDFSVFFNLESIMPVLNEALIDVAGSGGLAMFGVAGSGLDSALRTTLDAISFEVDIVEDHLISYSALVYEEKAGLLELLAYGDGPLSEAPFVSEPDSFELCFQFSFQ